MKHVKTVTVSKAEIDLFDGAGPWTAVSLWLEEVKGKGTTLVL